MTDWPQRRSEHGRPNPKDGSLFFRDTRGDRVNLVYGKLHRHSVPNYRTAGYGHSLGSRERPPTVIDSGHRQRQRKILELAKHSTGHPLKADPAFRNDIDDSSSFVPLDYPPAEPISSLDRIIPDDDPRQYYQYDNTAFSATQQDDSVRYIAIEVERRKHDLERAVTLRPEDIDAWLGLVQIQQKLVSPTGLQADQLSNRERCVLAELRIAIYKQAITAVTRMEDHARLVSGMMNEGTLVWDHEKQHAQWLKFIGSNSSFEVWLNYIDWLQFDNPSFSFADTIRTYLESIKTWTNKPASEERDTICIHLVLRVSVFLRQVGFCERATAVWQALLEINLFRQEDMSAGEALERFKTFWESGVPRIGEESAEGFCSRQQQRPPPKNDPGFTAADSDDQFDRWCRIEMAISEYAQIPARTEDSTSDQDPYRVVLFGDIEGFLFCITSPASQLALVDAFACFCGLPSLAGNRSPASWRTDSYLGSVTSGIDKSSITKNVVGSTESDLIALMTSTLDPICARAEVDYHGRSPWMQRAMYQICTVKPNLLSTALYALSMATADGEITVRKTAKSLLKKYPQALWIYGALALFEATIGNGQHADQVWAGAIEAGIGMAKNQNLLSDGDMIIIWHCWITQ